LKSLRLPSSGQPYRRLVKELAVEQGLETGQQLFIALGRKKLSVGKILEQHLPAVDQPSSPASEGSAGRIRQQEAGIVVAGQKNVAVRLANCCHPAPGDQLLGYISRGRGVTVHRQQCPNAAALNKDPQRLADVSWEHHGSQALRVEIEVRAADRRHLLEDISRVLSESGADIISASCLSSAPVVENRFVIEIGDRQQLQNCLQLLRQLPSVLSAQRRWADQ
jgi:GTP pyrophosphokinase